MELLPLLFKFLVFIYCVSHLKDKGKPRLTALIYASVYTVVLVISGLFSGSISWQYLDIVLGTFIYDFLFGYAWFALMHRYKANNAAFYSIIIAGIVISTALKFWLMSFNA